MNQRHRQSGSVGVQGMRGRTIAIAGSFARVVGIVFGTAVMIVAVAETLNAVCCCFASEREE